MSWDKIHDKHKKKFGRGFVMCENQKEKKFIVESIMEEMPFLKRGHVEKAVNHSCNTVIPPRNRKVFLDSVCNKIEKYHLSTL